MKHPALFVALVVMVAASAACVGQGTYDALKAEHDQNLAELANRESNLKQRDAAIADHKKTEAKLRADLDALDKQRQELEEQLQKLQSEHASTLKERSSLKESVTEMTTALSELQRRRRETEARLAEFRSLADKFKSLVSAGKLSVKIVNGRMVVSLATDVLFPAGSANLSREGKAAIAEVAQLLASIPNREFQVEGHTDNVPINTAQYRSNWELGAGRALTVVKTMIEAGMPAERVSAASFAETKPAAANDTPEGRAQNRRIEIIVVPDLSGMPGFDELNRLQQG